VLNRQRTLLIPLWNSELRWMVSYGQAKMVGLGGFLFPSDFHPRHSGLGPCRGNVSGFFFALN
jgi:hypothetical protein